jgi:hypothetical protein
MAFNREDSENKTAHDVLKTTVQTVEIFYNNSFIVKDEL